MRLLHLLRHAKSSWKEDVGDRERRLNRRGREAARRIGRQLPATVGVLDLVLCSSAVRTRETMELVLADYKSPPRSMIEDELYGASAETLLDRLRRLDDDNRNVLLIGHNPGLHELAVKLAGADSPILHALASGKFPTTARASFRLSDRWPALGGSRCELVAYVTVGSLRGEKG